MEVNKSEQKNVGCPLHSHPVHWEVFLEGGIAYIEMAARDIRSGGSRRKSRERIYLTPREGCGEVSWGSPVSLN